MRQVEFAIVQGDAKAYSTDVLVLKYARAFYGVAASVANALAEAGIRISLMQPEEGKSVIIKGAGFVKAGQVLFIGTPDLGAFKYEQIRRFGRDALITVAQEVPDAVEITMTLHGIGYGLDEVESCLSQFEGCLDALLLERSASILRNIQRITIIERDPARITRLHNALHTHVMATNARVKSRPIGIGVYSLDIPDMVGESVRESSSVAPERGHAFVAMPFSPKMSDVFYYGIQKPVRDAGLNCERMDHESFTGDIVQWLRERIATASVIVADLTGANPNVYLEVGYAWGKDRPVILLVDSESQQVAFDVQGHKRLIYNSIQDLEQKLAKELGELQKTRRI